MNHRVICREISYCRLPFSARFIRVVVSEIDHCAFRRGVQNTPIIQHDSQCCDYTVACDVLLTVTLRSDYPEAADHGNVTVNFIITAPHIVCL